MVFALKMDKIIDAIFATDTSFFTLDKNRQIIDPIPQTPVPVCVCTVLYRGMKTGISEASKRVSIFSFATQGGKQVSFYFRQRNWVQAREAQIRFPAS